MKELIKSLICIQQSLEAPKDMYNSFGKYHYRSLEGILAAIKPLLLEQGCGIRFQDEVVEHSGRTFLKTTLFFFNENGETITTTAEAEHASSKSGMDVSQITGASSSYARKYAMNAMFAIDDTKDADTDEHRTQIENFKQKNETTAKSQSNAVENKSSLSGEEILKIRNIIRAIKTQDNLLAFITDPANALIKKEKWFQTECTTVKSSLKKQGLWIEGKK